MNVLIDTNVLLDYIQQRSDFSAAAKIVEMCAKREIGGFMAAHSVPNMFFILRKDFSQEERRELLLALTALISVVGIDGAKINSALKQGNFKDFEDCLQSECAKEVNASFIITRNISDYALSTVPAITPADFLAQFAQ